MSRRPLPAIIVVGLLALLPAVGDGATAAAGDDDDEPVRALRIDGSGHGHGIGLSQWGAYTMARHGAGYADILATFYPGTALGTAAGEVAVTVDERSQARIAFPDGGELRSSRSGGGPAPGFPVTVAPGSTVTVNRVAAGYEVVGTAVPANRGGAVAYGQPSDCLLLCPSTTTTTTTTAPAEDDDSPPAGDGPEPGGQDDGGAPDETTTTTAPAHPVSPEPVWAVPVEGGTVHSVDRDRTYRGLFEVAGIDGGVTIRNHVDVEHYLMGMAEVPGNWPTAALAAQTIAARTFALRAGQLCDSDRCQVYVGIAGESPGQTAAVEATSGVVVTYHGGLAATHYSASAGGISATPAEGFGIPHEVPYLQAVEHPDVNPQPWQRDVALSEIGRTFAYPGEIVDVVVDEVGPSGRALAISMRGDAGPMPVDPNDFRRRLGLRSSLYELTTVNAGEPIPIPRVEEPEVVGNRAVDAVSRPTVAGPRVTFGSATSADETARGIAVAGAAASLVVATCFLAITVRRRGAGRVAPWPLRRR